MYPYDEPLYTISIISKMLDVHPQTLRHYEKEGFLKPSRTAGKVRLYSQRDIDKIKFILQLTRKLGVNLAGVDIILKLKLKIDKLEYDLKMNQNRSNKNNIVSDNKAIVPQQHNKNDEIIINDFNLDFENL